MIACDCYVCTSPDVKDKRLRTSILVQSAQTTIVVDTPPDFRYQMLRAQVKKLDAVLFTHPHKDHIAGLDDVRAFNFFNNKAMDVYANELTQKALKNEFAYAFSETKYPGVPEINLKLIELETFAIGDIPVIPVLVWHHKMPVLGFRFGSFTYITDANHIDASEKMKIRGSQTIVLNALRKQTHISHFTLQQASELVTELEAGSGYFTHISHQMGRHQEIETELPSNQHLAHDGLTLHFEGENL